MKVRRVLPCVCIDHAPDYIANGHDGMPALRVYSSRDGSYSFVAYCPDCKRGSLNTYRTSYGALKAWNDLQRQCWDEECSDFWTGELKDDCAPWRAATYRNLFED